MKYLKTDVKGVVSVWEDDVACMKCGKRATVNVNTETKVLKPKGWTMVFSGSFEPLKWLCPNCKLFSCDIILSLHGEQNDRS